MRLQREFSGVECEVCGRSIQGKPYNAIVDGVKLIVCPECAQLFSGWEFKPKPRPPATGKATARRPTIIRKRAQPRSPEELELELVEEYGQQIRRAREKLGLSHRDLGKKLGEKVSVLQKLETGKMSLDQTLAKKLEHALKIRLLVPSPTIPVKKETPVQKPYELTLGDIVTVRKRRTRKGAEEERGQ